VRETRQEQQLRTVDLLTGLGMARRQAMDEVELRIYSLALAEFPDAAISSVLMRLATTKREEYEPRIPELGDLIAMVRMEARRQDKPCDCEVCGNSRWVPAMQDGKTMARRCQCFIDWKAGRQCQMVLSQSLSAVHATDGGCL
jgi:hypothetical protein